MQDDFIQPYVRRLPTPVLVQTAPVASFEVILMTKGQTYQKVNICSGAELHSSPAFTSWSICLTDQNLAPCVPHTLEQAYSDFPFKTLLFPLFHEYPICLLG